MGIKTKIEDGYGNGNFAKINKEGAILTIAHNHPPVDEPVVSLPFRSFFENSDENMAVNGSSASIDFTINASNKFDIYVQSVSVLIGDGGSPTLNKFGALSALSNGVSMFYSNRFAGEYTLHNGIKTNLEFIRFGTGTIGIGTGTDAFLADVSGGGTEKSYLPIIDFTDFGFAFGLRLIKGSNDKLIFRINDNLTGLTTFNAIGYGTRL